MIAKIFRCGRGPRSDETNVELWVIDSSTGLYITIMYFDKNGCNFLAGLVATLGYWFGELFGSGASLRISEIKARYSVIATRGSFKEISDYHSEIVSAIDYRRNHFVARMRLKPVLTCALLCRALLGIAERSVVILILIVCQCVAR